MTRKLIKNATIVTLDPNLGVVDDCDLLIDDGLIAELRPALNHRRRMGQ
jgi:cytosine/adenosine deaminase-related metal-dependent hydrolase